MPNRPNRSRPLFAASLVLSLAACAATLPMTRPYQQTLSASCEALIGQLEFAIHKTAGRDAQYHLVEGYPLLRVNRLLAGLAGSVSSTQQRMDWLTKAAGLGVSSYMVELQNLPLKWRKQFPELATAQAKLQDCAWKHVNYLQADAKWQALQPAIKVPSEYFTGRKVLGLYPLSNLAMQAGIRDWQVETRTLFNSAEKPELPITVWQPEPSRQAAELITHWPTDSLGWPILAEEEWQSLAERYAPSWVIEQGGDYDLPGQPLAAAEFNQKNVVYWQPSVNQVHGRLLPQISYFIWFAERPKESALDILGGKLDGVVIRVTLGEKGEPLIYDSIHPCGCYHLFFPTPRLPHCAVDETRETALVPQAAPEQEFAVWLQSKTHYVSGLKPAPLDAYTQHYRLEPLDVLRRADVKGQRLFNVHGRVEGSQRLERWLLWTSGLVSPGGMRQWGSHATAFSGERYFDEAGLFDKEFCPVSVLK